jgi:hypothetical protein
MAEVLMDIGALRNRDERESHLPRQLRDGATVGINPRAERDVEAAAFVQLTDRRPEGAGHEPGIHPAADLGQIGRRNESGRKKRVQLARFPAGARPRQRRPRRENLDLPARAQLMQQSRIVEAAVRLALIREEIRDEEEPLQCRPLELGSVPSSSRR